MRFLRHTQRFGICAGRRVWDASQKSQVGSPYLARGYRDDFAIDFLAPTPDNSVSEVDMSYWFKRAWHEVRWPSHNPLVGVGRKSGANRRPRNEAGLTASGPCHPNG